MKTILFLNQMSQINIQLLIQNYEGDISTALGLLSYFHAQSC